MEDNVKGSGEKKKAQTVTVTIPRYKLNLYLPNGLLRPEIARGTFTQISAKYGDIMRAISLNHWCTFSEIEVAYINLGKRLRFEPMRTSEQIANAIKEMSEMGLIEMK